VPLGTEVPEGVRVRRVVKSKVYARLINATDILEGNGATPEENTGGRPCQGSSSRLCRCTATRRTINGVVDYQASCDGRRTRSAWRTTGTSIPRPLRSPGVPRLWAWKGSSRATNPVEGQRIGGNFPIRVQGVSLGRHLRPAAHNGRCTAADPGDDGRAGADRERFCAPVTGYVDVQAA